MDSELVSEAVRVRGLALPRASADLVDGLLLLLLDVREVLALVALAGLVVLRVVLLLVEETDPLAQEVTHLYLHGLLGVRTVRAVFPIVGELDAVRVVLVVAVGFGHQVVWLVKDDVVHRVAVVY